SSPSIYPPSLHDALPICRFKPRWQYSSDEDRLEINVIPLIDILLVVLIFITATTTFSTIEQLELKLPGGKQETIASQGNILLITDRKSTRLNSSHVSISY